MIKKNKEQLKVILVTAIITTLVILLIYYLIQGNQSKQHNTKPRDTKITQTSHSKDVVMSSKKALEDQEFYKKMLDTTLFTYVQYDNEMTFLFDGKVVAKTKDETDSSEEVDKVSKKIEVVSESDDQLLTTLAINFKDQESILTDWLSHKNFKMDKTGHITGKNLDGEFQIRTNGHQSIKEDMGGLSDSRLYYVKDGTEEVVYESYVDSDESLKEGSKVKTRGRLAVINSHYMDILSPLDYMSFLAFYHYDSLANIDEKNNDNDDDQTQKDKVKVVLDETYKVVQDNKVDFASLDPVNNQLLLHKKDQGIFDIKGNITSTNAYQHQASTENYILIDPAGIKLVKNEKGVNNEKYTFIESSYDDIVGYDNVASDTFTKLIISKHEGEVTATVNSVMTYTDDDNREDTAFVLMKTVGFSEALETGDIAKAFNPNENLKGPYIEVTSTYSELDTPSYIFINQDTKGEYTYTINHISYTSEEIETLVLGALIAIDVLYFNES